MKKLFCPQIRRSHQLRGPVEAPGGLLFRLGVGPLPGIYPAPSQAECLLHNCNPCPFTYRPSDELHTGTEYTRGVLSFPPETTCTIQTATTVMTYMSTPTAARPGSSAGELRESETEYKIDILKERVKLPENKPSLKLST